MKTNLEFIVNELIKTGFVLMSIKEKSYKEKWPSHIFIVAKRCNYAKKEI